MERVEGALVSVRLRGLDDDSAGNRALSATADVLPTDDAAYLVVPPAKRLAVAIVSARGNLFLSAALDGLPLSRHDVMSPEQFQKVLAEGRGGEYDVFVLDGWTPGPDGDGSLPPGRYVVFNAVPPGAGVVDKGVGGATQIVDWDRAHPVMRSVNLDPLIIGKNRAVEIVKPQAGGAGADVSAVVLASTTSGASIVEARGADWRAVIVPWDLMESNWPFDVGFIVFTAQAVGYVGGSSGGVIGQSQMVQAGSILSDRLPTGASGVTIESPAGNRAGWRRRRTGAWCSGRSARRGSIACRGRGARGRRIRGATGGTSDSSRRTCLIRASRTRHRRRRWSLRRGRWRRRTRWRRRERGKCGRGSCWARWRS
jgi:hypothetical protein